MVTCNDFSSTIETPQVTVFAPRKHKSHKHIAIILVAVVGGVAVALVLIAVSVLLLVRRRRRKESEVTFKSSMKSESKKDRRVLIFPMFVLLYIPKCKHFLHFIGSGIEIRNWNAAKVFSYKEIKAATNNFKEIIGRGSFGSVFLGKLPDGKQVAVKVRFDKTQLGADSFINEVCYCSTS